MLEVLSFGCRLNHLESQAIRVRAAEAGLTDAVIVNSCAVTGEAVRQVRQSIRRARRDDPSRPIIVTGCAAQIEPESFAAMPEVDRVIGNRSKLESASYGAAAAGQRLLLDDVMAPGGKWLPPAAEFGVRIRAFVEIQTGCDHRCTFCVIPFGRGYSRSLPVEAVVGEVRRLVEAGYPEIVLTGVDITAYGTDLGGEDTLGTLVRVILRDVPDMQRLRLSSVDSVEVDDALFDSFAREERLMPHLHLSLQHGDDLILKRMKRRHRRADAVGLVDKLRNLRPDIVFGADLIAGFPTETEAMFQNSQSVVEACGLSFLHVFPFSPRPGTPAARMPQLDRRLVSERARRLRQTGEAAMTAHLASESGMLRTVLVEQPGYGRTESFTPARFESKAPVGAMLHGRVIGQAGRDLLMAPLEAGTVSPQ